MKKASLYVRVSTDQQTIENQLLILTEAGLPPRGDPVSMLVHGGL